MKGKTNLVISNVMVDKLLNIGWILGFVYIIKLSQTDFLLGKILLQEIIVI